MLLLGIVTFCIAIPLCSNTVNAFHYTRLAVIIFLISALQTIGVINIGVEDISIYCSLVFQSDRTLFMEVLLFIVGGMCLMTFNPRSKGRDGMRQGSDTTVTWKDKVNMTDMFKERWRGDGDKGWDVKGEEGSVRSIEIEGVYGAVYSSSESGRNKEDEGMAMPKEYSLVVIFSVIGASMILSSNNLISIYLSTELQSFALYIIAALSRDSLRSVQASLKYFLLGAWSSAFILLGAGMIYTSTGSTSLVSMSDWISSTSTGPWGNASLGLMFIYCGYLFKVSAAPFHNWAPDVYQNTPTVVTMMLITIPKVSIITALFTLTKEFIDTKVMFVLLVVSVASIVIGAVTGLVQTQLRRLLAFSTINHVGFIVLCLGLGVESSINALIFYVFQYSLSTILIWICILAYEAGESDIRRRYRSVIVRVNYLSDLRQSFSMYSIVTFSLVMSLFSISGLPPLVGFIAKINVLWSSVEEGAYVSFMIAIMSSVVSASYYLKMIKIIMFDEPSSRNKEYFSKVIETPQRISNSNSNSNSDSNSSSNSNSNTEDHKVWRSNISPLHAFTIATSTAFISLFILDSELLINSIELALFTI